MKKLLLLGTIAALASSASADYSDYLEVTFDDQVVTDGSMIYCNHLLEGALPGEDNYSADVNFKSLEGDLVLILSVNIDTEATGYNGDTWGFPQVCEADGNCFPTKEQYFATLDEEGFMWMIEATEVLEDAEPIYTVTASVAYGEVDDYEEIEDSSMTFKIKYSKTYDAGVTGIEADSNEAPIYYNLLGKRVTNPSNGIYIVKQGKKVTKRFFE